MDSGPWENLYRMVSSYFVELGYLLIPAVTVVIQAWLAYWVYTNGRGKRGTIAFLVIVVAGMVWLLSVLGHALFDDPDHSIGERFAEAGLLGVPATVVVGNHYDETGEVEVEFVDAGTESVAPDAVAALVAAFTGC